MSQTLSYLTTTGTGVAIGTGGIKFGGFIRASDLAGTITIKDSATTVLVASADRSIILDSPIALRGPVTMTSSAGASFTVLFVDA